jgi:hypothetical protein
MINFCIIYLVMGVSMLPFFSKRLWDDIYEGIEDHIKDYEINSFYVRFLATLIVIMLILIWPLILAFVISRKE